MSDGYSSNGMSNNGKTKRDVLRSIAGFGLGSIAVTGVAAANNEKQSQEDSIHTAPEKTENKFIKKVKNSEQYNAVESMVTDGDFIPQFSQGEVYEIEKGHERFDTGGLLAFIPTLNTLDDSLSVDISGYSPSGNSSELEIWVKVSNENRPLGVLYTSNKTLQEESKGYVERFPASSDYPSDGLQPQINIPGWDDIREAAKSVIDSGKEILSDTADTFTETADYLTDEASDWAEEAYEQTEPLVENVDLDPTPEKEPPQDLVDKMNDIGADHEFTVDLQRSCAYAGSLTISGSISITLTGVGAGAGTLAVLGAGGLATIASCGVTEVINTFKSDTSCSFRFAYVFEETDGFGDTENWYIVVPCE